MNQMTGLVKGTGKKLSIFLGIAICMEFSLVCLKWLYSRSYTRFHIWIDVGILLLITITFVGTGMIIRRIELRRVNDVLLFQKEQVENTFKLLQVLVPIVERKTQTSSEEMEQMATLLKRMMKYYPQERLEDWEIQLIAYLLYISRIKIPDYLFMKKEKITIYEYMDIQEHCLIAQELLPHSPFYKRVIEAITYHHEKIDGSGYPEGLRSEQIPMMSRLLHILESYVAMTAPRSYRRVFTPREAIEELIDNAGTAYDSHIVEIFIQELSIPAEKNEKQELTSII